MGQFESRSHAARQKLAQAMRSFRSGRNAKALAPLLEIAASDHGDPDIYFNCAVLLQEMGKTAAAVSSYRKALAIAPGDAEAANNLGNVLRLQGDCGEAVAIFDRLVALQPHNSLFHHNRGLALQAYGRPEEAIAAFDNAIARNMRHGDAYFCKGELLQDLGMAAEAVTCYRRLLELEPGRAAAHNSLGVAYLDLGLNEDARSCFERALAIEPAYREAGLNLGNAFFELGLLHEALACQTESIKVDPGNGSAFSNRGNTLRALGRVHEALADFRSAVRLNPQDAEAHANLSYLLLLREEYAEAWAEYEWRWKTRGMKAEARRLGRTDFGLALPSGVFNADVFVAAEQGVGDEIMFAGMASQLSSTARSVVYECDARLVNLFRRSFPGCSIVAKADPPAVEIASHTTLPAGSLGRLFRNRIEDFPDRTAYLSPYSAAVAAWRDRLAELPFGLKVGIAWRGGVRQTRALERSIPLAALEGLLQVPGAVFVSLQHGDVDAEIAAANACHPGKLVAYADSQRDFDQLGALVCALDMVITVQTAVVHLAGALGRTCWAMVPFSPEWRYGLASERTPWYKSVRLYRQRARGEWDDVVASVAGDLRKTADSAATLRVGPGSASS
jgi:tetratricopeptide (TPR) repeat protein